MQNLQYCNGSSSIVVSANRCLIPIVVLQSSPYNLTIGASVIVRITAVNYYGNSTVSNAANGAYMIVLPDAPIQLAVNTTSTNATSIGITWSNGASNGGSPIIDYTISYD